MTSKKKAKKLDPIRFFLRNLIFFHLFQIYQVLNLHAKDVKLEIIVSLIHLSLVRVFQTRGEFAGAKMVSLSLFVPGVLNAFHV